MTITTLDVRDEYTATAGQTIFNYTFKIYESTDLNVYVTPSGDTPNDVNDLVTGYSVAGLGVAAGGSITLAAPASLGDKVTIASAIPQNRTTDYQNNGDFLPDTVNDDFDRAVSLIKQIGDQTDRGLVQAQANQGAKPLTIPNAEAGKYLRWKTDLSGMENVPATVSSQIVVAALSDYDDLDDAITQIGSTLTELWVNQDETMASNLTQPANLTLRGVDGFSIDTTGFTFTANGRIKGVEDMFEGTGTIAINAGIDAPDNVQVFNATGTITVSGSPISVNWFPTVVAAAAAGAEMIWPSGTYTGLDELSIYNAVHFGEEVILTADAACSTWVIAFGGDREGESGSSGGFKLNLPDAATSCVGMVLSTRYHSWERGHIWIDAKNTAHGHTGLEVSPESGETINIEFNSLPKVFVETGAVGVKFDPATEAISNTIFNELVVDSCLTGMEFENTGSHATDGKSRRIYCPNLILSNNTNYGIEISGDTGSQNAIYESELHVKFDANGTDIYATTSDGIFNLVVTGPDAVTTGVAAGETITVKEYLTDDVSIDTPDNYLTGFKMNKDDPVDLLIGIGVARGNGNDETIELATAPFVKQVDTAWAVGTDDGGLFTGALAADTWYHVFIIKNPTTGVVDAGIHLTLDPSGDLPAGYTKYRRIGAILTDGTPNIIAFYQWGDHFFWNDPQLDLDVSQGTSATTRTLAGAPTDIRTMALLNVFINVAAGRPNIRISSLDIADEAPSDTAAPLAESKIEVSGGFGLGSRVQCLTNTSAQIRTRSDVAATTLRISCQGYIDSRGKDG